MLLKASADAPWRVIKEEKEHFDYNRNLSKPASLWRRQYEAWGAAHLKDLLAVLPFIFLWSFDQVAVIAAFFQLHHNIKKARCAAPCSFGESLVIPGQDPSANWKH